MNYTKQDIERVLDENEAILNDGKAVEIINNDRSLIDRVAKFFVKAADLGRSVDKGLPKNEPKKWNGCLTSLEEDVE